MKINALKIPVIAIVLFTAMSSCQKEDKYTLENKEVRGSMVYVTQSSVPIEFNEDNVPITMQISMTGSGSIPEFGDLSMVATFKFSLITFQGWDFQATYTGTDPDDTFISTGASKLDQTLSGYVLELFSDGTGKFENLIGNGNTQIQIYPDQTGGTGEVAWKVTF